MSPHCSAPVVESENDNVMDTSASTDPIQSDDDTYVEPSAPEGPLSSTRKTRNRGAKSKGIYAEGEDSCYYSFRKATNHWLQQEYDADDDVDHEDNAPVSRPKKKRTDKIAHARSDTANDETPNSKRRASLDNMDYGMF